MEHVTSPKDQYTVFADVQVMSGSWRDGRIVVSRIPDIPHVLGGNLKSVVEQKYAVDRKHKQEA